MDHGGEVVAVGVTEPAFVDEPDFGVDSFETAVRQSMFNGGDDAVEVATDLSGEIQVWLQS